MFFMSRGEKNEGSSAILQSINLYGVETNLNNLNIIQICLKIQRQVCTHYCYFNEYIEQNANVTVAIFATVL